MKLQMNFVDVEQQATGEWFITKSHPTDVVVDVDSAFNEDVGEVYDEDDLADELKPHLKFNKPTFWVGYDQDDNITDITVCEEMKPVVELIRLEE